jgi:hypothetical protein
VHHDSGGIKKARPLQKHFFIHDKMPCFVDKFGAQHKENSLPSVYMELYLAFISNTAGFLGNPCSSKYEISISQKLIKVHPYFRHVNVPQGQA